jgi:hypothetical protein
MASVAIKWRSRGSLFEPTAFFGGAVSNPSQFTCAPRARTEGKTMSLRQLMGGSAAAIVAAGTIFASTISAQAMTLPSTHYAPPTIQHVDCAVGAHIGPLGGCILGNDNPPPVVIERRAADAPQPNDADGCATKSVTRTDGMGNSETKTKTNC